ncbi:hypothetical protein ABPG74_006231 [Tetrahymena malaccensis]
MEQKKEQSIGDKIISCYPYKKNEINKTVKPIVDAYFKDETASVENLMRDLALTLKKQKVSFESFCKIFSVVKFAVSKFSTSKKDQVPNNRFGEATIVLGANYLPPFYVQNQHNQDDKKYIKLTSLLNFTDQATIKGRLEKALAAKQLSVINLCMYALLKRKQQQIIEPLIIPKLVDEYFVDSLRRDPKAFPLSSLVVRLLSAESFSNQIVPKLVNLVKRAEENTDTVSNVLSLLPNNEQFDTSCFAVEIILTHLKPYYYSLTNQEKPSLAAFNVAKKIRSLPVLQQIVDGVVTILNQTNDEKKRMPILRILSGAAQALAYVQGDKKAVEAKIIQILGDNSNAVQTQEDMDVFNQIVDKLFENISTDFVFSADYAGLLKRKIAIQLANKWIYVATCKLCSSYIKRFSHERNQLNEIKELVEGINISIFVPNAKTPAKLVGTADQFLASLEVSALASNIESLAAITLPELKKQIKPVVLSDKVYINKQEFFNTNTQLQADLFFSSLTQIIQLNIPEVFSDIQTLVTLSNSYSQIFFASQKKATSQILAQQIKLNFKNNKGLVEVLAQGLFNFLFYQIELDSDRRLNKEQLSYATRYMTETFAKLTAEEVKSIQNIEYVPWIVNHPFTHVKIQRKFHKALIANDGAIKSAFKEIIGSKQLSNPYLLISDQMLQNPSQNVREAAKGYVSFLIEIQHYQFLEPYLVTLDVNNFNLNQCKNIAEFEETIIKTSDEFELSLLPVRTILVGLGYKVDPNIEINNAPVQEAPKKGGPKKPVQNQQNNQPTINQKKLFKPYLPQYENQTGHHFLDDEELLAKRKEELRERMIHFYRLSCHFYKIFSVSSNSDISEYFFNNLNECFFTMAVYKQTHANYRVILSNILRKYKAQIKSSATFLAEFTITIAQRENPTEKIIREYINFQSFINANLNPNNPNEAFIIPYLNKLNFHTINEDGFDMDTKVNALTFYNNIPPTYNNYLLALYKPFNNNINTLASNPISQVILEKLLNIIDSNDTSILFHNILNNTNSAKKVVLSSLISQASKINYHPSFEEIIKLRIMQIDRNQDIKNLSSQILSNCKYDMNADAINKFDVTEFIIDHSTENIDRFTELCFDIIKAHPDLQKVIFKKITEAAEACYDKKTNEESLTFYPKFIQYHMANIQPDQLTAIFNLFVSKYCNPSLTLLMDSSMQCGIELIKKFGSAHNNILVQIFDKYLKSNNPEDTNKQISSIVFLGVCSPYIKNKSLLETVSSKIILLFKNGSEDLQKSLAKCLPDLMSFFDNPKGLVEKTIQNLPFEPNVKQKKGQAYLVAGLIKGLGVNSIEQLNIFKYIDEDLEQKKDGQQKESILTLIICFLDVLGRVFEPYVSRVIKVLMHFFAETNETIKDLALSATKLLMSRLTGYGVKIILPQLLKGLEESAWRAKFNNIWALGNMAFCSPKQMSQCLPQIVPQLSNCLSDTHPKIREVANSSLTLIGSSIKNPEISEIVDILIKALSDPFDLNKSGLEILLKTRFVHYIDAPALSLVIPIVDYALTQKRETRPKEDACQVVGSISALIKDPKDIIPYMDILVGGLRNALSDNDNEVRLFASKAIGQICKTLGQANSEKYFKFIKDILESKTSTSIERSGAAQALSEIMCILGLDYFKNQLPSIFEKMQSKQNWVREGYIGIFVFVPVILKENFNPFIKEVLEATSEYISDDEEKTREIALRVLRILIQNFGESQTELLTGPVNEGLFSSNWRKRLSCVVLSAEMLEILQRMVRVEINDDLEKNIKREEGELTHKQKLLYQSYMAVYILRADEMEQVRLQSTQVWKNFVDNTPKTLKYGLSILFRILITAIVRPPPVENIAKTAICNFCQKYGESFFTQVLKVFQDMMRDYSEDLSKLRGTLLVLAEYCKNISGSYLRGFQEDMVQIIKPHVYTHENMFRSSVFYTLRIVSERVGEIGLLRSIFNEIFEKIRVASEQDALYETYLKIFDQLCQSKSDKILQYIIPQLFERPIPPSLIEVITNNSDVIGKIAYKYFKNRSGMELIFDEIFDNCSQIRKESLIYAMNQLSVNLNEDDSRYFILNIIDKINGLTKTYLNYKEDEQHLEVVLNVLKFYMVNTPIHLSEFNKDLINLVNPFIFEQQCPQLARHASTILSSIFTIINRKYFVQLLHTFELSLEDTLQRTKYENITEICGFNLGDEPGDGIRSYVELATTCLVYTPEEAFQDSIDLFKILIKYTKLENLQPFHFKLTGPLIRVANYKLEQDQKEKILQLFIQLFEKGIDLKPFVPQLLSTFSKICLEFPREREFQKLIAQNLCELVLVAPRKDMILHEMYSRSKEAEDKQVQKETFLYLTYKMLKYNQLAHDHKLFAKAFLEKIFKECESQQEESRELNINNICLYSKIIGLLSVHISETHISKYIEKSLTYFKESNEFKQTFEYLSAVLSIYERNPSYTNIPNDLGNIISALVLKFDKEYQYPSVNMLKKLIEVRANDSVSAYFSSQISQEVLKIDIELDEDIVHDEENEDEEGKEDDEDN